MKIAVYGIFYGQDCAWDRWADSISAADQAYICIRGNDQPITEQLRSTGIQVTEISFDRWRADHARNMAISMIPDDFSACICMDPNESLSKGWREQLSRVWMTGATRIRYRRAFRRSAAVYGLADSIHARRSYEWRRPVQETLHALGSECIALCDGLTIYGSKASRDPDSDNLALLKQAYEDDPSCAQTLFYLARENAICNQRDDAITLFKRYLSMDNAVWPAERSEAMLWLSRLMPHDRLRWLRLSVAEDPIRRETWVQLCNHYYEKTQWANLYAASMEGLVVSQRTHNKLDYEASWGGKLWDLAGLGAWNIGLKQESVYLFAEACKLEPDNQLMNHNYNIAKLAVGG